MIGQRGFVISLTVVTESSYAVSEAFAEKQTSCSHVLYSMHKTSSCASNVFVYVHIVNRPVDFSGFRIASVALVL